jgi:CheY-like chemotaxis protein
LTARPSATEGQAVTGAPSGAAAAVRESSPAAATVVTDTPTEAELLASPAESSRGVGRAPVAAGPHHALHGRKVLIVDDDVRNVFAITSVLELYGVTAVHATDGRKGIEILQANDDIDLVLMDLMMPEMDGHTTMRALREMPRFADLPVVAVTARAMPEDRAKSLSSGATDYITKPVDTEDLLTCMERCLEATP